MVFREFWSAYIFESSLPIPFTFASIDCPAFFLCRKNNFLFHVLLYVCSSLYRPFLACDPPVDCLVSSRSAICLWMTQVLQHNSHTCILLNWRRLPVYTTDRLIILCSHNVSTWAICNIQSYIQIFLSDIPCSRFDFNYIFFWLFCFFGDAMVSGWAMLDSCIL